tara:strand:- start:113 stop:571 length:459 start_codon:yes stop_codon:yes gene_type:complete
MAIPPRDQTPREVLNLAQAAEVEEIANRAANEAVAKSRGGRFGQDPLRSGSEMMRLAKAKKGDFNYSDQDITDLFATLKDLPIINGSLLEEVALISGDTTLDHGLGRELLGWIVVGQSASAAIYDKQGTNSDSGRTLILNSSAVATVNLWVF